MIPPKSPVIAGSERVQAQDIQCKDQGFTHIVS